MRTALRSSRLRRESGFPITVRPARADVAVARKIARDTGPAPEEIARLDLGRGRVPVIEDLFEANGWGDTWRDGIYDYVHYHSRIHEVLGIARGKGRVRFGGKTGRIFTLKAGDVAVLPAGTGHQCLSASGDFLVIGTYPPPGTYDECTTVEDRPAALKTISKVALPREDPVYGIGGPLSKLRKKAR
jgi:uncharacterized protein YjlB